MYVLYTAYSISTELHNLRTNLNLVFKSSFLYNNNMWAVFYNESLVMSSEHWACFFAEEVKRKHFSHYKKRLFVSTKQTQKQMENGKSVVCIDTHQNQKLPPEKERGIYIQIRRPFLSHSKKNFSFLSIPTFW